jgi:leucyl aminopeptidase (aminopeptidase T)
MADKLKKDAKGFAAKLPELARRIKDVNERKEKAAEYNGMAGKATKDACESQNVNKAAFTFVATCHRKESAEAQDRVLTLFALALGTGLLDQMDMFDERLKYIREELDKRTSEDAPRSAAPGAGMVAQLAAVN